MIHNSFQIDCRLSSPPIFEFRKDESTARFAVEISKKHDSINGVIESRADIDAKVKIKNSKIKEFRKLKVGTLMYVFGNFSVERQENMPNKIVLKINAIKLL